MMYLILPLSAGTVGTMLQLVAPMPLVFCCRMNPVEGDGHETIAVFVLVSVMASKGAPGVCRTEKQTPETSVKRVVAARCG